MDVKAILSLIGQLKQYNVLESLPEIVQDYSEILGDVSKQNGLQEKWSKIEPRLKLHLQNWAKCSDKGNTIVIA